MDSDKEMCRVALHFLSQLVEFCDLNGYGKTSATVYESRVFVKELTEYLKRKDQHAEAEEESK